MCGIAGKVARPGCGHGLTEEKKKRVLGSIRHRGPDTEGQYEDGCIWLGHTRLSIIDLTSAGDQPMTNPDGKFAITYNGEVYNFRELAKEMSFSDLRSKTDTEVVLKAFEKLGTDSFNKLNGIFAFAVYDKRVRKLWLVRDRLGVKPIYYRFDANGLTFASEIKAILALIDEVPACDVSSLSEWLYYGNTLGGRTLYQGIRQIQPGCYMEVDLASFTYNIKEYWALKRHANCSNIVQSSEREIITETRRLLEEAVRRQLVSDVPVGVFLSGGVDSSAITAIASKHYNGRLITYSAGFDDLTGADERPKARRIAALFGTEHREMYIKGDSVPDLVEKMVYHHDMPFSDSANIPLYLMASQISKITKVVLQGDGGDELFGGYRRYVSLSYRGWLNPIARYGRCLYGILPDSSFNRRVRRYLNAFGSDDTALTMARLLTPIDPSSSPEDLFTVTFRSILRQTDPFARYRECQSYFTCQDIGNQMSLVDMMIELPDIFLEKVDRATMAASLEVRVPFLDNDLVEYIVRIPGRSKIPWGKKKWLLKKSLEGIVPNDILYGPKTGFSVPFGYWLRASLKPMFFDHLSKFDHERPGILDTAVINKSYLAMERGEHDRSNVLWNILNFMIWANNSKVSIAM